MKKLTLLFILIALVSCKNETEKKDEKTETKEVVSEKNTKKIPTLAYHPEINVLVKDTVDDNMMLLGKINRKGFNNKAFIEWFKENYKEHTLDEATIEALKPKLKDVKIKAFMGTWCSDSQREIPALFKVLETAEFNIENLELIAVNHDKETPKHLEKGMDIQYVPTIIFYKNEKEIGRYVESAQETIEKDFLAILSETGYKHTYQE